MDVGYYLLIEEAQRVGVSLLDAIEALSEREPSEDGEAPVPTVDPDQGVAELNAMLKGVK